MAAVFISVEGGDGSGKSTQLENLKNYLEDRGFDYIFTREPGGTEIGEKIRDIILDPENAAMTDMAEALLYAASRAQHVREKILPALQQGKVVVCDRFVDSSLAYQAKGRSLGDVVWQVNAPAVDGCMPDITIFLNIAPEIAMERISGRGMDRLEKEALDFHKRVYDGYLELIKEDEKNAHRRIWNVDANRNPELVWEDIKGILDEKLGVSNVVR